MRRSGPPPQPPHLRLLRGNPGHRRIPMQGPEPTHGARCPKVLTPAAKREWRRLAPELERLGILTVLDRGSFASYCEAWADFIWACREIVQRGRIGQVRNGAEFTRPAVKIRHAAAKAILLLGAEFGFTPASRARVSFPGTGDEIDEDTARFFDGPQPTARRLARPPRPSAKRSDSPDDPRDSA